MANFLNSICKRAFDLFRNKFNIVYRPLSIQLAQNNKNPTTGHFLLLNQMIKKFLPPKLKLWFEPMFFSGFFCGFERCGSAAFLNFRGGTSSPPVATKAVRTIFRILHHVGKCKFERFAWLFSTD